MVNGIKIANEQAVSTIEALTKAIVDIGTMNAEQKTIRHALSVFAQKAKIESIVIQGATVIGDKKVTINVDKDAEIELKNE